MNKTNTKTRAEYQQQAQRRTLRFVHGRLEFTNFVFFFVFILFAYAVIDIALLNGKTPQSRIAKLDSYKQRRRDIIDRNGEILATNLPTISVYANPKKMLDKTNAAKKLAALLPDVSEKELTAKFNSNAKFVWIARQISPRLHKAVNRLGIAGVDYIPEDKRFYPHGPLTAHIVGYTNKDNNGLAGIEHDMDDILNWSDDEPLQLSVDIDLQYVLHEELYNQMQKFKAKGASGVIANANTGEVMAMVSLPDFNPNMYKKAKSNARFNRASLGLYEMGSTFKTFTTAMALDHDVATVNTVYDATNPIKINRFKIRDFHAKKRPLTLAEVFKYSSNIGTVKMLQDVGKERQKSFLQKLGLFDKTNVELAERGKPQVPRKWRDVNAYTISYGHGINVTPLHLTKAFTAMVNGGNLYPITILKTDKPASKTKVMRSATSRKVNELLRLVMTEGSGKNSDLEDYYIGGKTGTAEKISNEGKYVEGKVVATFVGAFPMHKPEYVVFTMVDEPSVAHIDDIRDATGGSVAAPVASRVIERTAPILGIQPVTEEEILQAKFGEQFSKAD